VRAQCRYVVTSTTARQLPLSPLTSSLSSLSLSRPSMDQDFEEAVDSGCGGCVADDASPVAFERDFGGGQFYSRSLGYGDAMWPFDGERAQRNRRASRAFFIRGAGERWRQERGRGRGWGLVNDSFVRCLLPTIGNCSRSIEGEGRGEIDVHFTVISSSRRSQNY
jgi:hypothetical protein